MVLGRCENGKKRKVFEMLFIFWPMEMRGRGGGGDARDMSLNNVFSFAFAVFFFSGISCESGDRHLHYSITSSSK